MLGHLVIKYFFPSKIINLLGFIILFIIIWKTSIGKNDLFGFIMIIYILSHFRYADAQGGLFNLLAFILIITCYITHKKFGEIRAKDPLINFLVIVLVLNNIFGWIIKNQMPISQRLLGVISFFGFLFMFYVCSKIVLTPERIKFFITVSIIILTYSFIMSLNKFFKIIRTELPIFGDTLHFGSDNIGGVVGYSPISGELGLLIFLLLMPFLLSSMTKSVFRIRREIIYFGLVITLLTILIANSRSVIILFTISLTVYFIMTYMTIVKTMRKRFGFILGMTVLTIVMIIVSPKLNLDRMIGRFEKLEPGDVSTSSLTTGIGINRTRAFELGARMLIRESWYIGYGWGITKSNTKAWFGVEDSNNMDPHSLYLSLPMLYGWVGSTAFLLIIFITIYRLIMIVLNNKNKNYYILLPAVGFTMLFVFFLINEYKITAMSQPNYFMIFWILLGLANSVINTSNFAINRNSRKHR